MNAEALVIQEDDLRSCGQTTLGDIQLRSGGSVFYTHLFDETVYRFKFSSDGRCLEMHRDNDPWLELSNDFRSNGSIDGRHATNRDQQDIDVANILHLLSTQSVPEVAQMANREFVQLDDVDSVLAPLPAFLTIMEGCEADDESIGYFVFAGALDDFGLASDALDVGVARVLMADRHDVGSLLAQSIAQIRRVRVCDNGGLGAFKPERRMAEPGDFQFISNIA